MLACELAVCGRRLEDVSGRKLEEAVGGGWACTSEMASRTAARTCGGWCMRLVGCNQ